MEVWIRDNNGPDSLGPILFTLEREAAQMVRASASYIISAEQA